MKCAICVETGQPLEFIEVSLPVPQAHEVIVHTAATAVCHSDLHLLDGTWPHPLPVIAGHESAGMVAAVGREVTQFKAGDKVVVCSVRACGHCYYCLIGASQCCTHTFPENTSVFTAVTGQTIHIGLRMGGFAEAMIVDHRQLARLPDTMPLDKAALLACGVLTGYGAVVNTAKVKPGKTVGVIGVGGVGVNSLQAAHLVGASHIVAIDIDEAKLEKAPNFGASHVVNSAQEDVQQQVLEITDGRGLDYCFVTAPVMAAAEMGIQLTGHLGETVIVGFGDWDQNIPVPIGQLMREKRITASRMGSGKVAVDIPLLAQYYLDGRLKLDELITNRYLFSEINTAIKASQTGAGLRNMILFS